MNQSWSKTRTGSKFRSEQSYQVLKEGNRIGLGFNLCVVPPQHYAGYVIQFQDGHQRLESDKSQTRVRQGSDRKVSQRSEYRGSQLSDA